MFEFTVPDGDWDYHGNGKYTFKPLVFVEKTEKKARKTAEVYLRDRIDFSVHFNGEDDD